MVKTLFGKKMGMTRYFLEEGKSIPVTIVKLGPCVVVQKKTADKDGYNAIQVGFEPQTEKRVNRPMKGHLKAAGDKLFRHLREIRVESTDPFELGQELGVDLFSVGEKVAVRGMSKGRGFAGVVKRWGFSGGKDTHGCRAHRVPGSIGTNTTPGRVLKGRKLPGQMGFRNLTVRNLKVLDVRPEMNVIALVGAVPGSRNSVIEVTKMEA
ncbi:MAG: 50S ribosomal protein L3 [Deltaproteobacteria bacterium]